MKRSVPVWQFWGFLFTAVLGTFLHFFFDLAGGGLAAALISAVNESIWEHQKLLFYPMTAFALWEYGAWGRKNEGFWHSQFLGILAGNGVIPAVYYTYTGMLGVSADWFNITIFFLAAGVAYWLTAKLLQRKATRRLPEKGAAAGILLLAIAFTVLTFLPPRIPYFRDPVTGTYGWFQR